MNKADPTIRDRLADAIENGDGLQFDSVLDEWLDLADKAPIDEMTEDLNASVRST